MQHCGVEKKLMKSRQDCHGMRVTMERVLVHHISGIKKEDKGVVWEKKII